MKTIPIISHYQLPATSITRCMLLEKEGFDSSDPIVYAYTALDQPLTIDGIKYLPGLDCTNIVSQSGLQVDNLEVTILPDIEDNPLVQDLMAGFWDYARYTIFEVNFRNPAAGVNILSKGWTGVAKANQAAWTIEFRSLKQALQQQLVMVTSKICRYRLGSTAMPQGLCFVDLADYTDAGTVIDVDSTRQFTGDTSQPDDWYGEGSVRFETGENAGYERKVRAYSGSDGLFTMATPFPFQIQVGDQFLATAGCRKRHERSATNPGGVSDCVDKFDNILNFGGEPHIQGMDILTAAPEVDVQ